MIALGQFTPTEDFSRSVFDVAKVRADFPIFKHRVNGKPLVYLDSAASAQKPKAVIDAMNRFYEDGYANIHRGVYELSEKATDLYEAARDKVRAFLNAKESREIIFVRGATEAINLVAGSYGRAFLKAGDEIVITALEHHSNIVPWQILCESLGAVLKVAPVSDEGEILLDRFQALLGPRTALVAITHVSNALGTVNPVKEMTAFAHARGVPVLVDGAQAVAHGRIDVQDLDCDFYVFSGHKLFGPSGIGVLYGKAKLLEKMPPYQGGGDMIRSVSFEKTVYNSLPFKFEAGTPHIAGAIGLGAAIDYLSALDWQALKAHEDEILKHASKALAQIPGLRLIGTARKKTGVVSFVMDQIHPHDIGTILDHEGIAIRAGHHCAQPLMDRLGVPATARASFAFYNTQADVEALIAGMHQVVEVFGHV